MNRLILFNSLGEEISLYSLGLIGLKLDIPSPSYRITTEILDGQAGELVVEKILNSRTLTAGFMATSDDYVDSLQSRDLLYEKIANGQFLYIAEEKQPTKRWKVHAAGWTPERVNAAITLFEVPLLVESGTSESINVTQKKYSTQTFRFKNEGNVAIDPRTHSETEIEFVGASSNLTIRNLTTNEEWSWDGETTETDTVLLKGVRSLKNASSIFGLSNKKLLTFISGWNDIEVIGATSDFEVNIRTRFYFL